MVIYCTFNKNCLEYQRTKLLTEPSHEGHGVVTQVFNPNNAWLYQSLNTQRSSVSDWIKGMGQHSLTFITWLCGGLCPLIFQIIIIGIQYIITDICKFLLVNSLLPLCVNFSHAYCRYILYTYNNRHQAFPEVASFCCQHTLLVTRGVSITENWQCFGEAE